MNVIDTVRERLLDFIGNQGAALTSRYSGGNSLTQGGIYNARSGMGTNLDKTESSFFVPSQQYNEYALQTLYAESWAARKFVDIPVDDMLIRWRTVSDPDMAEGVREVEERLDVIGKLAKTMKAARLYGTGLLIFMSEEDDLEDELNLDYVRPGDLTNLLMVTRYEASVHERETDPFSPDYGMAKIYRINTRTSSEAFNVHASRVIRVDGIKPISDTHSFGVYTTDWGNSEVIPVITPIIQEAAIASGVSHLTQEASMFVMKVTGLDLARSADDPIAAQQEEERLNTIAEQFNLNKSIYRTIFVDSQDGAERISVNWSGLPQLMDQAAQRLAAAAGIPSTRFWGQSPAGMSATGESDMRNYLLHVASMQRRMLSDPMRRIDQFIARELGLPNDEVIPYEWVPLAQMTEKEQADTFLVKVQGLQIAVDKGAMDENEFRDAIRPDATVGELEGDAPEKEPEPEPQIPPQFNVPGQAPPGLEGQEGEEEEEVETEDFSYALALADAAGRPFTATERRMIRAMNRQGKRHGREFATSLRRAFRVLGDLAHKAFLEAAREVGLGDIGEDFTPQQRRAIERTLDKIDFKHWVASYVTSSYENHVIRTLKGVTDLLDTELGVKINVPDPEATRIIADGGKRVGLVDFEEDTRRALFHSLAEAEKKGMGVEDLGHYIRDQVPAGRFVNAGPKYRAELIARTETANATNKSTLAVYENADTIKRVKVVDGQLPTSDDICKARNGTVVSFEEAQRLNSIEHPNHTMLFLPITR